MKFSTPLEYGARLYVAGAWLVMVLVMLAILPVAAVGVGIFALIRKAVSRG